MAEEKRKPFFQTLPGILTGTAAVLTAVTGLLAGLGVFSPSPSPPPEPNGVVVEEDIQDQVRTAASQWLAAENIGDVDALVGMVDIPYYDQDRKLVFSLDEYRGILDERDWDKRTEREFRFDRLAVHSVPELPPVADPDVAMDIDAAVSSLGLGDDDYCVAATVLDPLYGTYDIFLLFRVDAGEARLAGLIAPES